MDIEYTSTRKEVWNFYWFNWFNGNTKWVHARMIVATFIIVVLSDYLRHALEAETYLKAILISLFVITVFILMPQLMYKNKMRQLSINHEGINTEIGKRSGNIKWNEIKSIKKRNNIIYLLGKNGNGFIVPLRAFNDTTSQASFFKLATKFYSESKMPNKSFK